VNTEKTHARFWDAMRARFGVRWFTEFGDKPSAPWITLLNQYGPAQVKAALELMAEQKLAHPPTLPQFEALLKKASLKHDTGGKDFLRGYWISVVHETCMRHAGLLNLVPYGEKNYAALPDNMREVAIRKSQEMVDYAVDAELRTGQRTPGIEQHVNAELWRTLKLYQRDRASLQKTA
jgi:hypothetical protein